MEKQERTVVAIRMTPEERRLIKLVCVHTGETQAELFTRLARAELRRIQTQTPQIPSMEAMA